MPGTVSQRNTVPSIIASPPAAKGHFDLPLASPASVPSDKGLGECLLLDLIELSLADCPAIEQLLRLGDLSGRSA
jgi:hypothetical protein